MTTETTEQSPKRGRSPNYPGIDLGTAIERARQLYTGIRTNDSSATAIFKTWNFSATSGQGGVILAALLRFGLMSDEGSGTSRRARLTQDALAILRDTRDDSTDRDRVIQRLALLPPIHRELWAAYNGDLPPSDASLRFDLIHQRGFTENGADEFIREFRATIAFAKLDSSGKLPDDALIEQDGDDDDQQEQERPDRRGREHRVPARKPGMSVVSFQVGPRIIEIAAPGDPLTKAEIEALAAYLQVASRFAPDAASPRTSDPFFAGINQQTEEPPPA